MGRRSCRYVLHKVHLIVCLKRMGRRSCRNLLQKCNKKKRAQNKQQGDLISGLPDEVLVEILSRLPFKEAISTNILSKRWKYLWTFISSGLCFDSGKKLRDKVFRTEKFDRRLRDDRNAKFIAWVNNVLKSHEARVVDRFSVSFALELTHSSELDSWVSFAFEKRVERLEMNLTGFTGLTHRYQYNFPCFDKLKLHPWNYNRLTSLKLMSVNVSPEVVHQLLQKCPFLEQLCLVKSHTTTNLKIIGCDSFKLKYLDLYGCRPMENLEISAPNLVSFMYNGRCKQVPFKNVPLLSELSIGNYYCESFLSEPHKHSSYLSQLEKLTLIIPVNITTSWDPHLYLPVLSNLKVLELRVTVPLCYRVTYLISIIKAAPKLSKCVVKLLNYCGPPSTTVEREGKWSFKYPRHRRRSMECSHHQYLKEIELVGFVGLGSIFWLAVCLLQLSLVLEKVTIYTRHSGFQMGPAVFCNAFADRDDVDDDIEGAREIASKLRSHVPPGAEFLIV